MKIVLKVPAWCSRDYQAGETIDLPEDEARDFLARGLAEAPAAAKAPATSHAPNEPTGDAGDDDRGPSFTEDDAPAVGSSQPAAAEKPKSKRK